MPKERPFVFVPMLLAVLTLVVPCSSARVATPPIAQEKGYDAQKLKTGKTVSAEVSAGAVHAYRIKVKDGEPLRVVVTSEDGGVSASVFREDGAKVEPSGTAGGETFDLSAAAKTTYRLEVRAGNGRANARYTARVEEAGAIAPPREVTVERPAAPTLDPGEPVERELKGGEAHLYELKLGAGWYVEAVVEQRGIDVVVALVGPDGAKVIEVDSPNGTQGREPVTVVVESAGTHQLEVRSEDASAESGRYVATLVTARAATDQDRALLEARLLKEQATALRARGEFAEAAGFSERVLTLTESAFGPDHPEVASALNGLVMLYLDQGLYAKAEPLVLRSLAIREKALGPDHPDVARSLNNLARLYRSQGLYAKAETCTARALAIYEKVRGPDHPEVAVLASNLAAIYIDQGLFAKAEPLFARALAILEKALRPDHPDVAKLLNNLANLYNFQGHYAKAEPLITRSLAIREKAFGPEHPEVAASLDSLADLYVYQGHYAKAEPLYVRTLAIREKALGPDHPDVAKSASDLAMVYLDLGLYEKAEPLQSRALASLEKLLGPDHPNVALSLIHLANLYRLQGQYAKSESLLQRAMAINEKALGPDHTDVALTLDGLAVLYIDQRLYAKAEPLFARELAIQEKAFGPEHPQVATTLTRLGIVYQATGRIPEAVDFRTRANNARERDFARNLVVGSERARLEYLRVVSSELDQTLSLHLLVAPKDARARPCPRDRTPPQRKGPGCDGRHSRAPPAERLARRPEAARRPIGGAGAPLGDDLERTGSRRHRAASR